MSDHERTLWVQFSDLSWASDRAFLVNDTDRVLKLSEEKMAILKQIEAIQRRRFRMRSVVALCIVVGILAALLVPSC